MRFGSLDIVPRTADFAALLAVAAPGTGNDVFVEHVQRRAGAASASRGHVELEPKLKRTIESAFLFCARDSDTHARVKTSGTSFPRRAVHAGRTLMDASSRNRRPGSAAVTVTHGVSADVTASMMRTQSGA